MLTASQSFEALKAIRDDLADLHAELRTDSEGGSWVQIKSGNHRVDIFPPYDDPQRAQLLLAEEIPSIHFRDREAFLVTAAATEEDHAMTGQALARAQLVPGIVRDLLTRQPHDDRSSLWRVVPRPWVVS